MQLNYRLNTSFFKKKLSTQTILFIHGLFGNLSNFNTLSKELNKKNYNTLQIDLRNHGQSPHSDLMNYKEMSKDIFDLLDNLLINQCIVIGHSMGGKVAMTLPLISKYRITKIVIIDIAPVNYSIQKQNVFTAINYVTKSQVTTRNQAFDIMHQFIANSNIIFFC